MCVLIQCHSIATPHREVSIRNSQAIWAGNDTMVIHFELSHRDVLYGQPQHSTLSAWLPIGLKHIVDAVNPFSKKELLSRNRHCAYELSTEDIIVLDNELDLGGIMPNRDKEILRPNGVLIVGNDVGARDGGIGDLDGNIGVAGHVGAGHFAADGADEARTEEVADPLGEEILVREVPSVVHPDVEGAVEQHHLQGWPHAAVLRPSGRRAVRHHLHPTVLRPSGRRAVRHHLHPATAVAAPAAGERRGRREHGGGRRRGHGRRRRRRRVVVAVGDVHVGEPIRNGGVRRRGGRWRWRFRVVVEAGARGDGRAGVGARVGRVRRGGRVVRVVDVRRGRMRLRRRVGMVLRRRRVRLEQGGMVRVRLRLWPAAAAARRSNRGTNGTVRGRRRAAAAQSAAVEDTGMGTARTGKDTAAAGRGTLPHRGFRPPSPPVGRRSAGVGSSRRGFRFRFPWFDLALPSSISNWVPRRGRREGETRRALAARRVVEGWWWRRRRSRGRRARRGGGRRPDRGRSRERNDRETVGEVAVAVATPTRARLEDDPRAGRPTRTTAQGRKVGAVRTLTGL